LPPEQGARDPRPITTSGGALAAVSDSGAPVAAVSDWALLLEEAIAGRGVRSVYQPIVDLKRCTVAGYEALTRFDIGPPGGPDMWFAAAHEHGVAAELEATTLRAALAARPMLPPNTFMSVNVEPESLSSPGVMAIFAETASLSGLVVEVTEHRPLADPQRVQWMLERLRGRGALVAVDDAGSGYAGLQQILTLRPNILKLDRALVEGVDRDETKAALVEMFGIFANRVDAWLLVEGIETIGEARRCAALGVPLAQGYLFARPAEPWASIDSRVPPQLAPFASARDGTTLHGIIELLPTVHVDQSEDARSIFALDEAHHVVLVDDDDRPTGMLTLESMMNGETLPTLRVNVDSSPQELAHRLSTSTVGDTVLPAFVTDATGRYLGTVWIQRLLVTLANVAVTNR
jgi:EAL domain-containing protein (putative c-di-GMP-specific phosphodiesterase class I)